MRPQKAQKAQNETRSPSDEEGDAGAAQDPRLFSIVILAPIIQLSVLGYAATTDVKDIPIVDRRCGSIDGEPRAGPRFEASANFKIVGDAGSTTRSIHIWMAAGRGWR